MYLHTKVSFPRFWYVVLMLLQISVTDSHPSYDWQMFFLFAGFYHNDLESTNDFLKALPGFFLVCCADGKLVYISSNVTDFLGHSMVSKINRYQFLRICRSQFSHLYFNSLSILRDVLHISCKIAHSI